MYTRAKYSTRLHVWCTIRCWTLLLYV